MKESIVESLDSSKVETILHEVEADDSFKILRISDRTRFITPNPVNLVPISNDFMVSDRPDQNSIITVPAGSVVEVTGTECYFHSCVDLLIV
ncbi:hypothetical protein BDBG_01448 [Blastomyces gilchristii SLH14081]|uniref:Uncharacterized protein n=1 Tax=Blastomyces gilchristii (strain SLH14081) TaxID=559298 RepID=A0A179UEP0_BLAGS|nr:uncharacterized protein BDBG_01448 [Blastomyces gilchristii SLH14081]OAT04982.1 hypothetical protein BDBG_01448 [Blastomyces gilchristii SLH14081]